MPGGEERVPVAGEEGGEFLPLGGGRGFLLLLLLLVGGGRGFLLLGRGCGFLLLLGGGYGFLLLLGGG
jgi:hypothetical protein